MAAYPSYALQADSSREPLAASPAILEDVAADGTPLARVVRVPTKIHYRFTLLHRFLTQAEAEALEAFWLSSVNDTVTFIWKNGAACTATWAADGVRVDRMRTKGPWWMATAALRGSED